MSFGQLMRQERQAACRTLSEVAKMLGLSVPYLSDVERGRRAPLPIRHVRAVASFLGVSPDKLVMLAATERLLICPHCGKAIQ